MGVNQYNEYDEFLKNPINIVIPMAGAGSRFAVAGYDVPKPFIVFDNKMMIEHVLSSFKSINAIFTLIIQEKFLTEQRNQIEDLQKKYKLNIVTVPKLTMGAAITALAAHKAIDSSCDIIFADSDNIFNEQDVMNFVSSVRRRNLKGALLTFNSSNPCFSYAKVDDEGLLISTKEKEVISNHAICGMYYFKDLEDFKDAVIDLVVESDTQKGEYYMSNVYNHLKKFTDKIGIYDISHFDCVGTPQQLQEYLKEKICERV